MVRGLSTALKDLKGNVESSRNRLAGTARRAPCSMRTWTSPGVWTLGGAYTVWENQKSHMNLFIGARLLSLDTDLTWQLMAGIGYEFNWGDVMLNYRYLEYDQGNDGLIQDLAFGGGMLGVGFHF